MGTNQKNYKSSYAKKGKTTNNTNRGGARGGNNVVANTKIKNQKENIKSQLKEINIGVQNGVFVYTEALSIGDFAKKLNKPVTDVIKYFFNQGLMLNQNNVLTEEQIGELCLEFGLDFKKEISVTHENLLENYNSNDIEADLEKRPPIVTIMGHVDHGKTTLLDTIRDSNIISSEHGGITQHIGAYSVTTKHNHKITFIDTPGHEAFTQMRARGSAITDIVVLVVAADDGVMPQTREAINHAKAADVPIIVFLNKMDKTDADPENVMMQLAKEELTSEEWGGTTPYVKGSAKSSEGIDELLETIMLIAELADLKANKNRFAYGTVLEAHLDKSLGPVVTLLVQNGTLHQKDAMVCGVAFGNVRDLLDEHNKHCKEALPGSAVIVYGLDEVPNAGDKFMVFGDEKLARDVANKRKTIDIVNKRMKSQSLTLDSLSDQIREGKLKQIHIILKGDTQGSLEAVKASLLKLEIEGVKLSVIHAAVGSIIDSDVTLAVASNAIIIGFNVRPSSQVRKKANDESVDIRLHTIIYKITEEMEEAAHGMLDPEEIETIQGQAEVRQIFKHSDVGTIAGCHITDGKVTRNSRVRLIRDGVIIYTGELSSLKHIKEDLKEAKEGQECGMTVRNFNDIKEGDVIEAYVVEIKKRTAKK